MCPSLAATLAPRSSPKVEFRCEQGMFFPTKNPNRWHSKTFYLWCFGCGVKGVYRTSWIFRNLNSIVRDTTPINHFVRIVLKAITDVEEPCGMTQTACTQNPWMFCGAGSIFTLSSPFCFVLGVCLSSWKAAETECWELTSVRTH